MLSRKIRAGLLTVIQVSFLDQSCDDRLTPLAGVVQAALGAVTVDVEPLGTVTVVVELQRISEITDLYKIDFGVRLALHSLDNSRLGQIESVALMTVKDDSQFQQL